MTGNRLWILAAGIIFSFVTATSANALTANAAPDQRLTPGKLCTSDDPSFEKYDYPSHIARCKRHVTASEKSFVAHDYGDLPKSEWRNYEFDHLIPLCAGGSNDADNLWPQPIIEARRKDALEDEVCRGLRDGTMTQQEAIQQIWDWFDSVAL